MKNRCVRYFLPILVLSLAILVVLPSAAQDDPTALVFDFTPFPGNPVFSRADGEGWGSECGTIFAPQVIRHDGMYYLFYSGSCVRAGRPAALGFATSVDGVEWQVYEGNPILEPDGEGYDAMCVSIGVPVFDGDRWLLYYAGNSTPCAGPGQHIGRASAASPDGLWERDALPVLEAGAAGDWDAGFVMPHAVIHTPDGYIMYYSGGQEYLLPLPRLFGMATSPDGQNWTKYDDPTTTEPPFDHSDPIVELRDDGTTVPLELWSADIDLTEAGWEMFFSVTAAGVDALSAPTFLGYGTSEDGVQWRLHRDSEDAILTRQQVDQEWASSCICHPAFVRDEDRYQLYFTGCTDELNDCRIGMATGTIALELP